MWREESGSWWRMQQQTPDRTVGAELQLRKRISEQGPEELRGTLEEKRSVKGDTKKGRYGMRGFLRRWKENGIKAITYILFTI